MSTPTDTPILHCPHCLGEVAEQSHFCDACGMPITSHSTIGPMEQVWALGWLINRLLSRRPSAFVVVGVWFMAIPSLPVFLMVPMSIHFSVQSHSMWGGLTGLVSLLVSGCYLLLAVRVTLSYLRRPPRVPRDP